MPAIKDGINRDLYIQVLPQSRDLSGRVPKGTSGNPAGRPLGFRQQIKESTTEGRELVEVVLGVYYVTRPPVTENVWKLPLG